MFLLLLQIDNIYKYSETIFISFFTLLVTIQMGCRAGAPYIRCQ